LHVTTEGIDPNNYFDVTRANGMRVLVSSIELMRVIEVVLNGVCDYHPCGRVSNILKTFNHVNMAFARPGENKPMQMSDGTILCPSSTGTEIGEED